MIPCNVITWLASAGAIRFAIADYWMGRVKAITALIAYVRILGTRLTIAIAIKRMAVIHYGITTTSTAAVTLAQQHNLATRQDHALIQ